MIAFLLLVGLCLGLWLGRWPWYVAVLIILIAFIYAWFRYHRKGLIILLGCLILGGGVSLLDQITPPINEEYEGFVISSKENYFLFYSGGHRYYVYAKNNEYELFDYLQIKGTIREVTFATYESRFDFKSYLIDKGISYEIHVATMKVVFANPMRFNQRQSAFLDQFDEATATLLNALLFSRQDKESKLIQSASAMNLIFLFSMCGVYLRTMMAFCEYALKLRFSERTARLVTLGISIPILLLSLEKVAIHRLICCYGARIANDYLFKKKLTYCTITSIIGLIFLACDYHLAYQLSFMLGFGLSFLVMFLRLPIGVIPRRLRKVGMLIAIFVFLLPIQATMTHQIHILQPLFHSLIIPLNTIIFGLGVASFYIFPLTSLLSTLTQSLSLVLMFLSWFDFKIVIGELPWFFYFVYYGLYVALLYMVEGHRIVLSKKITLSVVLMIVVASLPVRNVLIEAIHFINVGQGDAILIQNHDKTILIDTGGNLHFDMAEEVLIPFFKRKMINKIDVLITTHDDFDHNGAVESLINFFSIRQTVNDKGAFPLAVDNLYLSNLNLIDHRESNDDSLVLSFRFLNLEWLLMGDASIKVEEELIKSNPYLDVDIVKIGHHGSKTSTSNEFIEHITPQEAIISVGASNYYGHPHHDVLTILTNHRVHIRRTDIEGTISYSRLAF